MVNMGCTAPLRRVKLGQEPCLNELILLTAVTAFAGRGYAGASLREIAAASGVSLSLLSHHFGSKPGLLAAVVESLQAACSAHVTGLRASLERASDAPALTHAWIQYAQSAFGTKTGLPYLRLLLRLQGDPEVSDDVRFLLDASERIVKRRLHQLFPHAPSDAVDVAWTVSVSGLYSVLANWGDGHAAPGMLPSTAARLEKFLVAGLRELMSGQSEMT